MALGAAVAIGLLAVGSMISEAEEDNQSSSNQETSTETDEQITTENQDALEADKSSTSKTVAKGTAASGTTVSATEMARQTGLDRHAEAGLAEDLYAEEFERQRYTVVDDGSSVFTPDRGVDKTLVRGSETKKMQVKHHGEPVGDSTLKQYTDSDIDVIASSNGLKEGTNPSDYRMEVITKDDLSLHRRIKLEWSRVKRGIHRAIKWAKSQKDSATNGLLGRIWNSLKSKGKKLLNGIKSVGRKLLSSVKSMVGRIFGAAKSAASWYSCLSLGKQILVGSVVVAAVAGTIYYVWKWYETEKDAKSGNGVSAVP